MFQLSKRLICSERVGEFGKLLGGSYQLFRKPFGSVWLLRIDTYIPDDINKVVLCFRKKFEFIQSVPPDRSAHCREHLF